MYIFDYSHIWEQMKKKTIRTFCSAKIQNKLKSAFDTEGKVNS